MTKRFRDRETGEEFELHRFGEDGFRLEIAFESIDEWDRFQKIARGARMRNLTIGGAPSLKSLENLEEI
ncbi:hypothetical protein [Leisingera sp. M658]|uniref:hypothetical protein n=1 Tax=Leisingera sp. M658 TaxID=2867015 RepID=UPI0021A2B9C6|nr:hypothetical protein [Leisingera sp. M658]UWQ73482.1 hypothetical protein K3724_13045 [Leisingera sp. M658]